MMIPLLIDLPGRSVRTPVLVENTLPVGRSAALLANHFGYPAADNTGLPLTYRLFAVDGKQALPGDRSLVDLQVGPGARLLLDTAESRYATVPVAKPTGQPTLHHPLGHRRLARRSVVITTGVLASVAFTGLGSGWTFAVVSHALARRSTTQNQRPIRLSAALHFPAHQRVVHTVAWSPDGTLLASGGDDARVLVWTPEGVTRTAIAHQAPVRALAWSPEGGRLITAAASQVRFLTTLTGNLLAVRNHTAQVTSVAWSAKAQMQAVSGSADTRVIVWQTAQYEAQTVFAGHTTGVQAVTFSADGHTVASSSQGGAVRVWAAANGRELHPLYLPTRLLVPALAFAPVGGTLAAGETDGLIRLWDGMRCQATGASDQGRICVDGAQRLRISKHTIRALAWSPDAKYLASGSVDGTLTLWQPGQSQIPVLSMIVQAGTPVQSISWSPDGKRLATAAGTSVIVWSLVA